MVIDSKVEFLPDHGESSLVSDEDPVLPPRDGDVDVVDVSDLAVDRVERILSPGLQVLLPTIQLEREGKSVDVAR